MYLKIIQGSDLKMLFYFLLSIFFLVSRMIVFACNFTNKVKYVYQYTILNIFTKQNLRNRSNTIKSMQEIFILSTLAHSQVKADHVS